MKNPFENLTSFWLKLGAALLAALTTLVAATFLPASQYVLELVEKVRDLGALGVALYAAAYITAVLLFVPGFILTLAAGFLYGPWWGTLLVSPVSIFASCLAFLLGRTLLREKITEHVEARPRFSAIDKAVGKEGLMIIGLLRLSPLFPFSLLNYALGLTRVRFRDYLIASAIGMLPGTFLYVSMGSLLTNLSELAAGAESNSSLGQKLLYWGGLGATLFVTIYIAKVARRALKSKLDLPDEANQSGKDGERDEDSFGRTETQR